MMDDSGFSESEVTHKQHYHLLEALASMRSQNKSDVILVCQSKEFPAQQNILKANSPYFEAMFQSGMTEVTSGKVVFKDMDADTLDILLDFMYSGDVSKIDSEERTINVLAASHMMQLDLLFQFCCKKLVAILSPQNFAEIWTVLEIYSRHGICMDVLQFIISNIKDVIKEPEFLFLPLTKIRYLLNIASRQPQITDDLLLGLLKWLNHDFDGREDSANELLTCINPKFVSSNVMKSVLENKVVVFPEKILQKMELLQWSNAYQKQNCTKSVENAGVAECLGVKLLFIGEFRSNTSSILFKWIPSFLTLSGEGKIAKCCVQMLDLYAMIWLPPQKVPSLSLKGTAICHHKGKIYIVGGSLKSFYVIYDIATNSLEYVSCNEFDGKLDGFLCSVGDHLYFVDGRERSCQVTCFAPGGVNALVRSPSYPNLSVTSVVASQHFVCVYCDKNETEKCSYCVVYRDGDLVWSSIVLFHNFPEDVDYFFASFCNFQYGLYEAEGDHVRLKYNNATHNWIAKTFQEGPIGITDLTSVYRSSQGYQSLVFCSTSDSPYQIPDYLFNPELYKWNKLPLPKFQCCIAEEGIIKKVYVADNYL